MEPTSEPTTDRLTVMENQIAEIHTFCRNLAGLLDNLASNPMVQAMIPPGIFGQGAG